jgi:hypothetical protein
MGNHEENPPDDDDNKKSRKNAVNTENTHYYGKRCQHCVKEGSKYQLQDALVDIPNLK